MSDDTPPPGLTREGPWETIPIADAQTRLGELAAHVAASRRDVALTDEKGRVVVLLVSPQALEDLEDDLALAQNRLDELDGVEATPHDEFVRP
ncbi:type II toxin-antitoxin system Phd/YefM family antitoxin [Streptomyces sp. B6B3]|uniref:type II toxin-antitoxin system Phd/YefM family antitoxin n=1 Tax=Streptomyces sp. B6B3 TaxID=3153570 RepID=UPI00325E2051